MAADPLGAPAWPSRLIVLAALPLLLFAWSVHLLATDALPWIARVAWVPSLGVDLSLYIDGLALQFLLLITGIGALVFVYASSYMAGDPHRVRLFAWLLVFMIAMVGSVTTDNLVALFVFWEVTSITSFLLIGFKHESEAARRAAQQALIVTGAGGLFLLSGILLLGEMAGTYSIQQILATAPSLLVHRGLPAALACLFIGAFTKSAQWPFHFWLPNAMAAPTPVSAYLHSATMVKLGVYLLARLKPAFSGLWYWDLTLVTVGALTAVWAMVLAMRERDLKRILAWSTVSALGTLIVLIGVPGHGAAAATSAFLLAHALYKAPLFFVAGNVDHSTGTRSIDHLPGLARVMPWTAAAAMLAAVSMAGVPLSFGYIAKDLIGIAKVQGDALAWVGYSTLLVSAATVAVAGVAGIRVFWHRGGVSVPREIHEASAPMLAVPLLAGSLGIVFGLVPALADPLVRVAAGAMVWPVVAALPMPAALDVTTTPTVIVVGLLIFLGWDDLHRRLDRFDRGGRYAISAWYERGMNTVPLIAAWLITRVQHGSLPGYLAMVLAFVLTTAGAAWLAGLPHAWPVWSTPGLGLTGAAIAIVTAAVAVCKVRDPFVMLLSSGVAGLGSALLFLFLGAPDVALTQFAVEVAFVVVVAAALLRIQRLELPPVRVEWRLLRIGLAIASGVLIAVLLLTASAGPFDTALPDYFGARSVPDAHGRNVVNVIIVDFRAVDTLGEITVVALTFIASLPLLQLLRRRGTGPS